VEQGPAETDDAQDHDFILAAKIDKLLA